MSILNRANPFYFTNFPWNVASPLNADHEAKSDPNAPFDQGWFLLTDETNFLLTDDSNLLLAGA